MSLLKTASDALLHAHSTLWYVKNNSLFRDRPGLLRAVSDAISVVFAAMKEVDRAMKTESESITRVTPKECPECGWTHHLMWGWIGTDWVTCANCGHRVPLEDKKMAKVSSRGKLEVPKRMYCPICQCEVEAKENEYGDQACVDCSQPLATPQYGKMYEPPGPPPDGTMFQINKEGTVGMMGWICPVCGAGVSPLTEVCPCQEIKPDAEGRRYDIEDPGSPVYDRLFRRDRQPGTDYTENARHLSDP
jgi:hypothetical protein